MKAQAKVRLRLQHIYVRFAFPLPSRKNLPGRRKSDIIDHRRLQAKDLNINQSTLPQEPTKATRNNLGKGIRKIRLRSGSSTPRLEVQIESLSRAAAIQSKGRQAMGQETKTPLLRRTQGTGKSLNLDDILLAKGGLPRGELDHSAPSWLLEETKSSHTDGPMH